MIIWLVTHTALFIFSLLISIITFTVLLIQFK
jgi:hypothetical protein